MDQMPSHDLEIRDQRISRRLRWHGAATHCLEKIAVECEAGAGAIAAKCQRTRSKSRYCPRQSLPHVPPLTRKPKCTAFMAPFKDISRRRRN